MFLIISQTRARMLQKSVWEISTLFYPVSEWRCYHACIRNIVGIRWSEDCLIFPVRFPILLRRQLYIAMYPGAKTSVYQLNLVNAVNVDDIALCAPQRTLLLTCINFNPSWISKHIHYKARDQITYPFPNYGNGKVISPHTLLCMWLLTHAVIKVNPYY